MLHRLKIGLLVGLGLNLIAIPASLADIDWISTYNSTGNSLILTPNTGLPETLVGTVFIQDNSPNGFLVQVQFTGSLEAVNNAATLDYTLIYNGVSVPLTAGSWATVEDTHTLIPECVTGCSREIRIRIHQADMISQPAGSFKDTLSFQLLPK